MKKPDITKGKWMQSEYVKGNVVNDKERSIASCMGYSTNTNNGEHIQESLANSELIIEAGNLTNEGWNIEVLPELVEVLEDIIIGINDGHYKLIPYDEETTECFSTIKKAEQALKKAKFEE